MSVGGAFHYQLRLSTPARPFLSMHLRYHYSIPPPTRGLLETVRNRLFPSPTAEESKQDVHHLTERLLQVPIGSMTPKELDDAKEAISLQMEAKPVSEVNVRKAWDILDRIAEELKHKDSAVCMALEEQTDLLNFTLNGWMRSVGHHRTFRSEKRNVLLEAKAVLSRMDRYQPCFPVDSTSYNITLRAINKYVPKQSKAGSIKSVRLLETIVEHMNKETSKGNSSIAPTVITYTLLIKGIAFSKVPDMNDRVNRILSIMKERGVEPDTRLYNSLLEVCVKSGHESAPDHAESLLRRMQQEYESGKNVKPDVFSFGTVIRAWATLGDGDEATRASDIVVHMQKQFDEGSTDVEPDSKCYGFAIAVWTKRGEISKAEGLLNQMKEKNIDPDYYCYGPLISACAKSNDANAADKYLEEAKSLNITPSHHDYKRVINAWQRSIDPKAAARIEILTKEMNCGKH